VEPHGEGIGGPLQIKAEHLVEKVDPAALLNGEIFQNVHDGIRGKVVQLFQDRFAVGVIEFLVNRIHHNAPIKRNILSYLYTTAKSVISQGEISWMP